MQKPVVQAVRPALRTALWLICIMIPTSFVTTLLQYFGILGQIALWLEPFFEWMGLRGEAALVMITSASMALYPAIAVIQAIPFTMREVTILALMMLIAHNLFVETAVQKKTGSSIPAMVALRLSCAVAAGCFLNWVLPPDDRILLHGMPADSLLFREVMQNWFSGSLYLTCMIVCIMISLNLLQIILVEFGIMQRSVRFMSPLMKPLGLSPNVSFAWIISYVTGLAWGSATLIENRKHEKITRKESDLLNYHIAVSHSWLEDTLLFVAIGVSAWWLLWPRLVLATAVVWAKRGWDGRRGKLKNFLPDSGDK